MPTGNAKADNATAATFAEPLAVGLRFERGRLVVVLDDGREVSVPLDWYPTLQRARPGVRSQWRPIGRGVGFHWPKLDLDLSVRGIVSGLPEIIPAPPRRAAARPRSRPVAAR